MLDLVIPVYNEDRNILRTFDEIEKKVKSPLRAFVVYDSDSDTTLPVVRENASKYGFEIKSVKNLFGRGALNAIKTGLQIAEGECVLVCMADLSDDLSAVDPMVRKMKKGHYAVVCGSRYVKGGEHNGGPFLKSLMSKWAGLSLHYLSGIPTHDATNSFKLYSKEILSAVTIESTGGFELGLEIVTKAYCSGYRISEVPSKWYDRDEGESRFKLWSWLPHYLHWYFYCIFKSFRVRFR